MSKVLVTGLGLVVEDRQRAGWNVLERDLCAAGLGAMVGGLDRRASSTGSNRRDDKLLSVEDLISVHAAERAVDDAFGGPPPADRVWGAVSFTTSKLTLENERTLPFTHFRKADHTPDTGAFRRAIDAAEIQIDPLGLLKRLDNNVSWWLCKSYGFGGVNLQLGQCLNPDLWALVAAVDLVASGDCDSVVVGGGETIAQSAVHLCDRQQEDVSESDPRVGGGALFFVLERDGLAGARGARACINLDFETHTVDAAVAGHYAIGTPGLVTALEVFRHCVGIGEPEASARSGSASIGPLRLERLG